MKIIKIFLAILIFLLFVGGLWFYLEHSIPSEETVKQEFLKRNTDFENAEIVGVELIFDHAPKDVLTYLIKVNESNSDEKKLDEFSIKQDWKFQWHWCDDQTENKCN